MVARWWARLPKSSLGVLEDTKMDVVPGTAPLEDRDELNVARRSANSNVKYSKGGIILVPQPSDDPRDPLNLPLWRRDLITGILCLWSVIASTLSPLLAASSIELLFYYKPTPSFTKIALLTGWHLLGVGIAALVFVPLARIWGKRHIYLIGTLLIVISSAWGGGSGQNYDSLAAARFFQGIGLAPFESLVNASVADLYFVHERGLRMAISNLCLFGGAFFTPVIVGVIGYNPSLRWPWTFYFVAIFGAVLLPFMILFVPETTYNRGDAFSVQEVTYTTDDLARKEATSSSSQSSQTEKPALEAQTASAPIAVPALLSMHNLRVFHGRFTDAPFWKLLLRPLPLFFHPAVFWALLIQGAIIGWTVFIGIILAAVYYAPPINKSEKEIGFLYTGAFIGALIGFAIAGALAWVPIWMAKRNKGIFEPEFRLVLVIPMLIFGCAGLYGWGFTSPKILQYGAIVPDVFFGLEVVGMVIGAVASALYLVDAHKDITVESFTCLIVFKNIFSFALCFKGYDWLRTSGIEPTFIAIGSVQAGICALTIPMYIFGKWNRSFFARHDILKLCRLDHVPGTPPGPFDRFIDRYLIRTFARLAFWTA